MGKIHTHYDNLKVSRMAPQEVIRAAYKALSQKYHPDKNPGDEKAARIMAILNSAYETLSDPQRRKEHDEWIVSEEWEVEWLESTHHEDGHHPPGSDKAGGWNPEHVRQATRRRRRRGQWKWWAGLAACLALGWIGGASMVAEPRMLSAMLSNAWGGGKTLNANAAEAPPQQPPRDTGVGRSNPLRDAWAVARAGGEAHPKPAPVKVLSVSQVVLPNVGTECDSETPAQALAAPNGEPWPAHSGYLEGFPVGNRGEDMQLTLDNAENASAVFVKVYDLERRANVRYAYVQAHDKLLLDQLSNGKYEIRYQNLDAAANPGACAAANRTTTAATEVAPSTVSN